MGSGISLCCRSNRTPLVDSPRSKSCKPSSLSIIDAGTDSISDQPNEDGDIMDDFEKELQQLNDETLRAEEMSPPPTLDDSMSDNDTSIPKIAAIVTSKARESPQDAISTSVSRTNSSGAMEIRDSSKNTEEIIEALDAFTNETLQEDVLDLNYKDALPDESVTEVLDEAQPEVAQSAPEEHVEGTETMITPTEDTTDDPRMQTDSNGIELLELQEMVVNEEITENELQENVEDGKPQEIDEDELEMDGTNNDLFQEKAKEDEASAEMVDDVDSELLQIEGEMVVGEELLNSSALEDTEGQETIADGVENSEIVTKYIEESENPETEPTNFEEHIDTTDAPDLPTDADGMEETSQLESSEIVAEGEIDENEPQGNIDEDKPQEIDVSESEADGIDKDQSNENAEENEQAPFDIMDVVDPSMAQEEEETADNDGVLNSLTLEDGSEERETDAENVENQETPINQFDQSDNAAYTSTDLPEHINDEQPQESSQVPEMNIRLPRSASFVDVEEDFPVETDENNPLDIEDVGLSSVVNLEDELPVAQQNYEKVKKIENSDLEGQMQEENEAIEVDENVEGNDNYIEETENEIFDESEVFAISDFIEEQQPSQLENIEEVLPEFESENVTSETPGDNDLHQNASFAEEQSLLSPVNENSPFEIENTEENVFQASDDNVLADENDDRDNMLEQDDAPTSAENVIDSESAIKEKPEAESDETNHVSGFDAHEQDNLQSELDNEKLTPDLKENGFLEEQFNELLGEVDKEVSNDDEEEIWSKLQKDLQLEEEEQRNLAAIKIQSTFRGYKTRKDFNEMPRNIDETVDEIDIVNDFVENAPEDQPSVQEEVSLENNDDNKELTGALAGVTESIATIALIMTDTPQQNPPLFSMGEKDNKDDESDGNIESENAMDIIDEILSNEREVNDVAEEPMSNGEEIRDVQLIESYVITSSVADNSTSSESQEAPITLENSQENESILVKDIDDSTNGTGNSKTEAVASDPGVVFELYVESNETTNDGLLESYCPQREDLSREKHLKSIKDSQTENSEIDSDAAESLDKMTLHDANGSIQQNQLDPGLLERENLAATKIQAGYRGQQDRKRVKDLKHHMAENVSSTGADVDKQEELENAAATKIQAGFRGHQDRKRIHNAKCHTAEAGGTVQADFHIVDEERHQFNYGDIQQVQPDPCSIELQNAAATKIQAGFRGHQDRKRIKELKVPTVDHNVNKGYFLEESFLSGDEVHFWEKGTSPKATDLENVAATKIQAGFRGHQDRKRVKHLQHLNAEKNVVDSETLRCMDTDDAHEQSHGDEQSNENPYLKERENAAATTIQAGFRGHQARKRVKNLQYPLSENDGIENDASQFTDAIYEPEESSVEKEHNLCLKELENAAATKIQAGFRGYRDRKNTKHLKKPARTKDLINNKETCHFIDRDCSPDGDKFIQYSERNQLGKENIAATKIQAGFRGHQDRKRIKCLKENIAATKIQAGFRGHQDRKRVKHLKESINKSETIQSDSFNYDDDDEKASALDYDQSAEVIQFELENSAATKIQAGFRGHKDRKRVKNLQRPVNENNIFENYWVESMGGASDHDQLNAEQSHKNQCSNEVKHAAATSLFDQNAFLQYGERNPLDKENIAATKIQAGFRGHQDRKRIKRLKDSTIKNEITESTSSVNYTDGNSALESDQSAEDIQFKLKNDAATKIQAGFRGHQDRKRVKNLQCRVIENEDVDDDRAEGVSDPDQSNVEQSHENVCINELENAAATRIQAGFRGYQDRKNIKNLKKDATTNDLVNEKNLIERDIGVQDSERNLVDKENSAATKIQAGFRGNQDRKRMKQLKDSVTTSETIDCDFCNEEALFLDDDQSTEAMQIEEQQNAAATKIQAGFRGHQDRKRVKNLKISTDIAE